MKLIETKEVTTYTLEIESTELRAICTALKHVSGCGYVGGYRVNLEHLAIQLNEILGDS